jgi:hypothetical protein
LIIHHGNIEEYYEFMFVDDRKLDKNESELLITVMNGLLKPFWFTFHKQMEIFFFRLQYVQYDDCVWNPFLIQLKDRKYIFCEAISG